MKRKILIFLSLLLIFVFALSMGACGSDEPEEQETQNILYFANETYTVERYNTITLDANYNGEETIVWTSSNESIVKVNDGLVLGCALGNAEVVAKVGENEAKCTVVVRATTSYISLNVGQTEIELAKGKSKTVNAGIVNNEGLNLSNVFTEYLFATENESVATVTADGVVNAREVGTTNLIVTANYAGEILQEKVQVIVKENVNVTFDKTKVELYSNTKLGTLQKSEKLNVIIYENDVHISNPEVEYTVVDDSIATVSPDGTVTGKKEGVTYANVSYVTELDNTITAEIKVIVRCPVVYLNEQPLTLEVFASENYELDLNPLDDYLDAEMTAIKIEDDLNKSIDAVIDDGIVKLENEMLNYGQRKLNFTVNSEITFSFDAEVITKYISSAEELANFAYEYGGRDSLGNYEGYFVLTENIDMTDVVVNSVADVWASDVNYGFKGIFDGKGHTIYGIEGKSVFGVVGSEGIVKNTAFYSTEPVELAVVSGLFMGKMENVYIHTELENIEAPHFSSVSFRTIGDPIFKNVVIEVGSVYSEGKSTFIHDASGNITTENVYLITPSKTDPVTEKTVLQLTHFASSDEKNFLGLDVSSEYWEYVDDIYKFKSCAYFDKIKLFTVDKNTIDVTSGGTLTWGAISNADGYEIIINGKHYLSSTTSFENVENGSIIMIRALGNGLIYRNGNYSDKYIHLQVDGNYVADFNSQPYVNLVGVANVPEHNPASLTAEIVTNKADKKGATAEGAIKITAITSNLSFCDFRLTLPKSLTSNTATYRIMISSESTDGEWVRTINKDGGGLIHCLKPDYVGVSEEDVWYTFTYGEQTDPSYIDFRVGCNDGSGNTVVFYLDCIMDGDCRMELQQELNSKIMQELADELTGDYVANFNSKLYASLFSVPNSNLAPESLTTEIVSNVEDDYGSTAESAVKITVKPGSGGSCEFRLMLPKSFIDATSTYKIMISSEESVGLKKIMRPGLFNFISIGDDDNITSEIGVTSMDKWYEARYTIPGWVDINNYLDYVDFNVSCDNGSDGTVVFYLAWIAD